MNYSLIIVASIAVVYSALATAWLIRFRKQRDAAVEDALWWERYNTRDGGIN